jgi:hypothetical protein
MLANREVLTSREVLEAERVLTWLRNIAEAFLERDDTLSPAEIKEYQALFKCTTVALDQLTMLEEVS